MTVSVALCTYNGSSYLAAQLDSILGQCCPVTEIVMCDDRSTDDTIGIAEMYAVNYPGIIRIYINEDNLGGKKNFEKALSCCTGDVIFFSDQDDVWHADKVSTTMAAFGAHPGVWAIGTDASLTDSNGRPVPGEFWRSLGFTALDFQRHGQSGLYQYVLSYGNIIAGCLLAIKKEACPYILPFRFLDEMWHDEWIVMVLSAMNRFLLMDKCLVSYRLHHNQQIGLGTGQQQSYLAYRELIKDTERLKQTPLLLLTTRWQAYSRAVKYAGAVPELQPALPVFKKAFQEARQVFLGQFGLVARKARLAKWYFSREFDTSLRDVFIR